ncbi:FAR1-related protein [Sesbania bispinosa]|nr:FAR1-related protein [Sesbania bispinosa]
MNLCSGNDVEDNESQSGGQCSRAICLEDEMGGYFVVEEDSGNNYFVHGEDGNGNHLSSQNNENMGGVFFCGDENGGTFLVGEDWSENSAEEPICVKIGVLRWKKEFVRLNLKLDDHNHERLGAVHCSMFPAYRRMSDSDVVQMNSMMKVGIRPPNIFNTFASQARGYEKIGFRKKDMYNKISEQRRNVCSDAKGAVEYLEFTNGFEDCMLGYYDVGTFRRKRMELICKYELEDNPWVIGLYEKRKMWATTYLRGKFFGGFRTISRCEGFHSELVSGIAQAARCTIYRVNHQTGRSGECRVSIYDSTKELKFACLRMESRGLPCEHIVAVLAYLGIDELPETVLKRWSMCANDGLGNSDGDGNNLLDVGRTARRAALNGLYNFVNDFKAATIEKYNAEREKILDEWRKCQVEEGNDNGGGDRGCNVGNDMLRDPVRAATKGSADASTSGGIRVRRKQNCSICKLPGHNKVTCPSSGQQFTPRHQASVAGPSARHGDEVEADEEYEYFDTDTHQIHKPGLLDQDVRMWSEGCPSNLLDRKESWKKEHFSGKDMEIGDLKRKLATLRG